MSRNSKRPRALSIHPRVSAGSTFFEKSNTAAPHRKRQPSAAMRLHCEQHPGDTMAATRLAKLEKGAA